MLLFLIKYLFILVFLIWTRRATWHSWEYFLLLNVPQDSIRHFSLLLIADVNKSPTVCAHFSPPLLSPSLFVRFFRSLIFCSVFFSLHFSHFALPAMSSHPRIHKHYWLLVNACCFLKQRQSVEYCNAFTAVLRWGLALQWVSLFCCLCIFGRQTEICWKLLSLLPLLHRFCTEALDF